MAREVNTVLAQIVAEARGVSEAKGEEIVKNMRSANQYQVRSVYTDPSYHIRILLLTGFTGGCLVMKKKQAISDTLHLRLSAAMTCQVTRPAFCSTTI